MGKKRKVSNHDQEQQYMSDLKTELALMTRERDELQARVEELQLKLMKAQRKLDEMTEMMMPNAVDLGGNPIRLGIARDTEPAPRVRSALNSLPSAGQRNGEPPGDSNQAETSRQLPGDRKAEKHHPWDRCRDCAYFVESHCDMTTIIHYHGDKTKRLAIDMPCDKFVRGKDD